MIWKGRLNMINYKTIIAPIIAVIALILENVLKVKLPEELQGNIVDTISNFVALAVVIYGIFKNHHIEKPAEEQE
jgi:hypothetical protein